MARLTPRYLATSRAVWSSARIRLAVAMSFALSFAFETIRGRRGCANEMVRMPRFLVRRRSHQVGQDRSAGKAKARFRRGEASARCQVPVTVPRAVESIRPG